MDLPSLPMTLPPVLLLMVSETCNAPHVSSGHERSVVAAVVVQLKLFGHSVTQG